MSGVFSWVASSGVVQGVIIGATLAFLTTILVLDSVTKAETTTVNGWSSIRRSGALVVRTIDWWVTSSVAMSLPFFGPYRCLGRVT